MELWAFLGVAFVGVAYLIWRSRRGTSRGIDTLTKGLPDDLRDKNVGTKGAPYVGRAEDGRQGQERRRG